MNPRAIDTLIAIHIFGWTKKLGCWIDENRTVKELPHYSESIADTWTVFETAYFDGWFVGRNANGKYEIINPWCDNTIVSTADTAHMAICLAALKALGVKYDE